MLILRTLGELQLLSGKEPLRVSRIREMAMLTYVACSGGRTLTRAHLAEMFWPGSDRRLGLHSLSQAMYRLSMRAPGLAFREDSRVVAVQTGSLQVDLVQFRRHVEQREYDSARLLYGGPFLDSFVVDGTQEFDEWMEQTRREVALAAEDMFRALLSKAEDAADWTAAQQLAAQLLRLNPYDEAAAATEIAALAARGEKARAEERYGEVEQALRSVGRAPSSRLLDATRAIEEPAAAPGDAPDCALPLIGRAAEFDLLKRRLSSAQCRNGSAILITGKAGIGKTRLCEQLRRLAALRGFRTLASAGAPLLRGTPYAATRELLGSFSKEEVGRLCPEWKDVLLSILFPQSSGTDVGTNYGQPTPRDWIYRAVYALLDTAAGEAPVLILLEDVQWLDAATLDLLHFLVTRATRARWLLVGTARPNELLGEAATSLRDSLDAMPLTELAPAATREFMNEYCRRVGKCMSHDETLNVDRAAAGHPLFLLELLRRWARRGTIRQQGFAGLPGNSIETFLAARLSAASTEARSLAEALAVLGGSCEPETVGAVAAVEVDRLADAIDELTAAGLWKVGERLEFIHDLVREAAYDRLAPFRRHMLHARAARTLRTKGGVDVCALAMHNHLGNLHEQAYRYATAAAKLMQRRFGDLEAQPYWRLAVANAQTKGRRINATLGLAECLLGCKANGEADLLFGQILELPGLPAEIRLMAQARRLFITARLGGQSSCGNACRELVARAEALGSRLANLVVAQAVGFAVGGGGREQEMREFIPFICRVCDEAPDGLRKLKAVNMAVQLLALVGETARAHVYLNVALAIAGKYGHAYSGELRGVRGLLFMLQGSPNDADQEFLAATKVMGVDRLPASVRSNWAVLCIELGRFHDATLHLRAAIQSAGETGSTYELSLGQSNLAVAEYERGDVQAARERCEAALRVSGQSGRSWHEPEVHGLLGLLALPTDLPSADEHRRFLATCTGVRLGNDYSYGLIFLARMDERDGDLESAMRRLEAGIAAYAGRDFFVHARLELEKARLLGLTDRDAGLALAREVRGRALEAGAVLLLDRSEALIRELKRPRPAGAKRRGGRTGKWGAAHRRRAGDETAAGA